MRNKKADYTAFGTVMRRGEVAGLKWEDFRADTKTLIIARAMAQTNGAVTEKLPKSGRKRVVDQATKLIIADVPTMIVSEWIGTLQQILLKMFMPTFCHTCKSRQ